MAQPDPRLSGTVFACLPGARDISLVRSHGIDFNQFPTFGDVTGAEEIKAVRQHDSVFHTILKLLPWEEFTRSIERHEAGDRARAFSHESHLTAMLYAQLAGAVSLRDVEAGLSSHAVRLAEAGATPARRSSLAEANRDRPAAVFLDLLAVMIHRAHRKMRRAVRTLTLLIDSTSLPLNALSRGWARFSDKVCAAKLHIVYDPNADCPVHTALTTANVNDITAAKAMPIVAGATHVFDLGYYDYGWWAELDGAGCRIVTRLKKNTPLTVTRALPVEEGGAILSDRIGRLPIRQASNRRNPFHKEVREVRVRIETGKILRVLTNDLDAPAQEVADLYKQRWAIELFFRWIKQTLKITRFLGTSGNAVRIQIAAALITFLLLRLAQRTQEAVRSPLLFLRLVRINLMHRKGLDELLGPGQETERPPGQEAPA